MRFGACLKGSRSYWNKGKGELDDIIIEVRTPTVFFTLSAAYTKWHALHRIMLGMPPSNPSDHQRWRIQNIIANPHHASQYIHRRFVIFLEEVLQKGLQHLPSLTPCCTDSFSPTQQMAFNIVLSHFNHSNSIPPLEMIIQGTAGTRKSFLISCLADAFASIHPDKPSPLLLLAPTGVAAFHINA